MSQFRVMCSPGPYSGGVMYTDGSVDGSLKAEEWKKLEEIFSKGSTLEIVKALRLTDNTPLDVSDFTMVQMNRSVIGGMNAALSKLRVGLCVALVNDKRPLRTNRIYFKRVVRPEVTDLHLSQIRAAPCH